MSSLIQRFIEEKQKRLTLRNQQIQSRIAFSHECLQDRLSRQSAIAQKLSQARQKRLGEEQQRLILAAEKQRQRAQDCQMRTIGVNTQLSTFHSQRMTDSHIARLDRLGFVKHRAQNTRLQLAMLRQQRWIVTNQEKQKRALDVSQRQAFVAANLRTLGERRQVMATLAERKRILTMEERARIMSENLEILGNARKKAALIDSDRRQKDVAQRSITMAAQLHKQNTLRQQMGRELAQELELYAKKISADVWGSLVPAPLEKAKTAIAAAIVQVPVIPAKAPVKSPEANFPPATVPQLETATTIPNKVRHFIQHYLSQLPGNPTLLQVVNNRDTVRDLLARGANELKVDPSEILNTLLQMVDPT